MRRRGASLAALVATVLIGTTCATAVGAPIRYDVDTLPQGRLVRAPYMDGLSIHHGGTTVDVPAQLRTGTADRFALLGKSADGDWLVAHDDVADPESPSEGMRNGVAVYRVSAAGATTLFSEQQEGWASEEEFNWRLSDSHRRVVQWDHPEGDWVIATVRKLDGAVVQRMSLGYAQGVLDFSGPRMVVANGDPQYKDLYGNLPYGTLLWRVGRKPVRISKRPAVFASFRRNVLVLRGTHGRWGFTRLSAPRRLRWQAHFRPLRLSPDGRRVVGVVQRPWKGRWIDANGVVQVRRVRDGKVLMTVRREARYSAAELGWDGNRAIFFADSGATRDALVRCRIGAGCRRANGLTDHVTLAFELHLEGFLS